MAGVMSQIFENLLFTWHWAWGRGTHQEDKVTASPSNLVSDSCIIQSSLKGSETSRSACTCLTLFNPEFPE